MKLLMEGGNRITKTIANLEIAQQIKEKYSYATTNFYEEMYHSKGSSSPCVNYELPDGQVVIVDKERFRVPEALFKFWLIGLDGDRIDYTVHDSIPDAILILVWNCIRILCYREETLDSQDSKND
jgi:hypothetical protein